MRFALLISLSLMALICLSSQAAQAACSSPAGNAGDMVFNNTYKVLQYCDGTDWIAASKLSCVVGFRNPMAFSIGAGNTVATLGSYTVPNVTDRILIVATGTENNADATVNEPISATFDGTPMTRAGWVSEVTGASNVAALFYLVNPPVSTGDIVVTYDTAPGGSGGIFVHAGTLSCVAPQAPEAVVQATGTSSIISTDITTLTSQAVVVDAISFSHYDPPGAGNDQAEVFWRNTVSTGAGTSYKTVPTAGTVSMDWQSYSGTDRVAHVLAAFAPSSNSVSGGTGCASPTGAAGDMVFNGNQDVLQYCNGSQWVPMGDTQSALGDHMKVFVTSQAYMGNIGGVGGADAECQKLADSAGLDGMYFAWLASSASNQPSARFEQSSIPYRMVSGKRIADNWADLTDGTVDTSITLDENGNLVNGLQKVWTDITSVGGHKSGSWDCTKWNSTSSSAYYGQVGAIDSFWTDTSNLTACNGSHHLYCFQQDIDKVTGAHKKVFVSSATYNANLGGVAGADAKCQALADAVSLGGTYKAWIAESATAEPRDTFTQSADPYALVDGTKVADNWADLIDGTVDYAIIKDENGDWVNGTGKVWTDVLSSGALKHDSWDCTNWTSTGSSGYHGFVGAVDTTWTDPNSLVDCNQPQHLYCFEQ